MNRLLAGAHLLRDMIDGRVERGEAKGGRTPAVIARAAVVEILDTDGNVFPTGLSNCGLYIIDSKNVTR